MHSTDADNEQFSLQVLLQILLKISDGDEEFRILKWTVQCSGFDEDLGILNEQLKVQMLMNSSHVQMLMSS